MSPLKRWTLRVLALGVSGLALPASADVTVQPGVTGQRAVFESTGDLAVDGHCFANVSGVPTDGVLMLSSSAASFKIGNLFLSGTLNEYATTFPGTILVRNGTTQLASFSGGSLYLAGRCKNSSDCSNTKWEPEVWNDSRWVNCNNCYNYGNDTRTDNFAQPGYASGHLYTDITVDAVREAAMWDGLQWVGWDFPGNTYSCGTGHLIFMAIYPSFDYHWWRLDQAQGRWSHKRGGTPAQDTDDADQPISNPLTSGRFGYTENGGFYCNCGGHANIAGWRSCPGTSVMTLSPSSDASAAFTVTLDAFSGRPNPTFALTNEEMQTVTMLVGAACTAPAGAPSVQHRYPTKFLGYRGATIERSAARGITKPAGPGTPSVQLARGTARISAANAPDACRQAIKGSADLDVLDANQTMEKYLIDLARAKGVINDLEYGVIHKGMQGKW